MKAKIKRTGEIIDVFWSSYNSSKNISFYKEKGCNGRGKEWSEEELNFTDTIDWEQRRYEIAKDLFSHYDNMTTEGIVSLANELIKELKKDNNY